MPLPMPLPRRRLLAAGLAAAALKLSRPALAQAPSPLPDLTIWGPPAGPSITAIQAIASGLLTPLAGKVAFKAWRNPDEMRAGLASKTMEVVILPTITAANLLNRGFPIRLVNVLTHGVLYAIGTDPALTRIASWKGKRIATPFRNDTPEIILKRLLAHTGLVPGRDVHLEPTGTPLEAVQLLLAGRVDVAFVPEPAASGAAFRAMLSLKTVHRLLDVQDAWRAAMGNDAALPQAGLAVTAALAERAPDLVTALHAAMVTAAAAANRDPDTAARHAAAALDLPAPVLARSIPGSHLVAVRARDARPALEALFAMVAEADPAIIGGRLPDPVLYW